MTCSLIVAFTAGVIAGVVLCHYRRPGAAAGFKSNVTIEPKGKP
jgi:hypothetical protein